MRLWLKRPNWWVKIQLHDLHLKDPAWMSCDYLLFLRALFIFAWFILSCSYFFAPGLTQLFQDVRLAAVFSKESGCIPKTFMPALSVTLNLRFCLPRDLSPSAISQRSWFFFRRVGTHGILVRFRTSVMWRSFLRQFKWNLFNIFSCIVRLLIFYFLS